MTKEYEKPIEYWFDCECQLYKSDEPFEMKATKAWAVLSVAFACGDISWDRQRLLFGEFISKEMGLRRCGVCNGKYVLTQDCYNGYNLEIDAEH